MSSFSVVIPTRNEVGNLTRLSEYVLCFDEVIFVDGNSTDGTREKILELFPEAILIDQDAYKGKGSALCLGLLKVSSEYAIILDADTPVSTEEIRVMKSIFLRDLKLDLVKTSRHLPGGNSSDLTGIRKLGALFFALLTRKLYSVNWTEMVYGFWGIKVSSMASLQLTEILKSKTSRYPFHNIPYGSSFEFDQLVFLKSHKMKFNIIEVPSIELERVNGKSNLFAPFDGLRTLLTIAREKRNT